MIDIERGIEEGQSGRGISSRLGDGRQGTRKLRVNGDQAARTGATRTGRGGLRGKRRRTVFSPVGVEAEHGTETCIDCDEQRRKEDACASELCHGEDLSSDVTSDSAGRPGRVPVRNRQCGTAVALLVSAAADLAFPQLCAEDSGAAK